MRAKYSRPPLLAAAVAAVLMLPGCDVKLETKVIHPREVWTLFRHADDHETVVFCPLPFNCPSNIQGTAPSWVPSPPAHFSVGFDHWFDEGAPICGCWEAVSHAYRGAVRFDVFDLPKNFVSATLMLRPTESEHLEGDTASNDESGTIAGIWLASTKWFQTSTTVFTDENNTSTAHVEVPSFTPESNEWAVPFPEHPGSAFPEKGFR